MPNIGDIMAASTKNKLEMRLTRTSWNLVAAPEIAAPAKLLPEGGGIFGL